MNLAKISEATKIVGYTLNNYTILLCFAWVSARANLYDIIYVSGCGAVGSARLLGSRGRRFKSCHPDQIL